MKIKTGDTVKILSGKDREKTGKVIQVLFHDRKRIWFVVVEGVRKMKKHLRGKRLGDTGQTIELFAPIPMSTVMLIDPKINRSTRVGFRIEGGQKKRVSKKTGEYIDV